MKKTFLTSILALALSLMLNSAGAQTWKTFTISTGQGFKPTCLQFPTESVGYCLGVTADNSAQCIYKSTDFGQTWTPIYSKYSLAFLSFCDANNGVVAFMNTLTGVDSLAITTDGGKTWVASPWRTAQVIGLTAMTYVKPGIIIAAVQVPYTPATGTFGMGVNICAPYAGQYYSSGFTPFICKTAGTIMHTLPGIDISNYMTNTYWVYNSMIYMGTSKIITPPVGTLVDIYFTDSNHGWATSATTTYYTANGGTTWTTCTGSQGGYIASNGSIIYTVQTSVNNVTVYKSTNCINFTAVSAVMWVPPTSIAITPDGLPALGIMTLATVPCVMTEMKNQNLTIGVSSVTYGTPDFSANVTDSSGIAATLTSMDATTATIVSGNVHAVKAGTVKLIATAPGNAIFNAAADTQTLTITKAPLKLKATNQTVPYGTKFTTEISDSGLVNGDKITAITMPTESSSATVTSASGTYWLALSGGSAANYVLTLDSGILTITKVPLTVTANNQTKVYGSANPELTISYDGFVNGDTYIAAPTISTDAVKSSLVGSYDITLTGGAFSSNYAVTLVNGLLKITQATLTVTADSAVREEGQMNPTFQLTYSGFVNGDSLATSMISDTPIVTCSANAYSPAGIYPIVVSGGISGDYIFKYVDGVLRVTPNLGLDEQASKVAAYPNPMSDVINVSTGSAEPISVKLYDISGKVVSENFMASGQVNVQDLMPGTYVLRMGNTAIKMIKK